MTPLRLLLPGVLLTATAGYVDAIGFIELGGYFVSFMSGNTTQLGADAAFGMAGAALLAAGLLGLFFAGSVMGGYLAIMGGERWGPAAISALVCLSVLITMLLLSLDVPPTLAMLSLAGGAGAQNAILPSTGSVRVGATFVTGTLFGAGFDMARALRGLAPPWRWAQHLLVWAALLAGAVVGSLVYRQWGPQGLALPAMLYGVFTTIFLIWRPAAIIHQ